MFDDDDGYPRIAEDGKVDLGIDNPEYNDYLRAGVPGYLIPFNYEERARQSSNNEVYSGPESKWWIWVLVILFVLMMCAIAIGPSLIG